MAFYEKTDSNSILLSLYSKLKDYYPAVYLNNRPSVSKGQDDFIVIKMNGAAQSYNSEWEVLSSKGVIMIQIFTKSNSSGMKDMQKESYIRKLVVSNLPCFTTNYSFAYKGEVGDRDLLNYHVKIINIDYYIN